MLNNKGFAVSAVLYTLLIAFLIFLAVTLNELASSTNLINHANDELTNGGSSVKVVKVGDEKKLQVNLNGKIIYCNPTSDCSGNSFFNFDSSSEYYIFSIGEEVTNKENCNKPNCVFISKSDYDSIELK